MMKKLIFVIASIAAISIVASCSKDEEIPEIWRGGEETKVFALSLDSIVVDAEGATVDIDVAQLTDTVYDWRFFELVMTVDGISRTTVGFPKKGNYFPDNHHYIGNWLELEKVNDTTLRVKVAKNDGPRRHAHLSFWSYLSVSLGILQLDGRPTDVE